MSFRAQYWLAGISLMFAGCASEPETYPVPEQHAPFRPSAGSAAEFVTMDSPDAGKFIVQDVLPFEGGAWRWTRAEPELRFKLSSVEHRTLFYEFTVHDRTFRDTGPLTVSFFVNGHLAGEERYDSFGPKLFEKPIPPEWLQAGKETVVRARIHPAWRSPDGFFFGVLLQRAGFLR